MDDLRKTLGKFKENFRKNLEKFKKNLRSVLYHGDAFCAKGTKIFISYNLKHIKMLKFNFSFQKSLVVIVSILCVLAQSFFGGVLGGSLRADAAGESAGSVVINEIAWTGSLDNSNDEWIELYNPTSQSVDLTGWYIEDDYTDKYTIASGAVPAHGYFLIEDNENAVASATADAVISISLANSGDSLILKNASGSVIDSVNAGGEAWYAGNNTSKATMERIDPTVLADSASNFKSAVSSNGSTGSLGGTILGTPKSQNSVYKGGVSQTKVEFDLSNETPLQGGTITATVIINGANDLFSYGFDVLYDPAKLEYVSTKEEGFLNKNGATPTAFDFSLENGQAGKLIIGCARVISPASGVSGSGNLFAITFKVKGVKDDALSLTFGGGSFITNSSGDALANFVNASFKVGSNQIDTISNLTVSAGISNYSLKLSWTASSGGADDYLIFRKGPDGKFTQIGSTKDIYFVDSDSLSNGGKIIPNTVYEYQVKAVKNGIQSNPLSISGSENRGLKGDNNRSGRVDGKDLDNLARHYGDILAEEDFDALIDTNFDGVIDGSDLIDIGANFGLKI